MPSQPVTRAALLLEGAAALLGSGLSVGRAPVPGAFALGRDANGEPCRVARNWRDDRLGNPFEKAWAITCRGVTAARTS